MHIQTAYFPYGEKYREVRNSMTNHTLFETANKLIADETLEDSLKDYIRQYIQYKFRDPAVFSTLTEVHYHLFRKRKDNTQKEKLMTMIEIVMLTGDIADDMQDKDAISTPWYYVHDSTNLNIILSLLMLCLKELNQSEDQHETDWMNQIFHQLLLQSIHGQQIDLNNNLKSEADYLHMCQLKSGSLIKLACLLGAGQIETKAKDKIEEYCNYLGVVFQLRNDVNDLKNGFVKNDLLYKKKTLPIIYYLNTCDPAYDQIKDYYLDDSSSLDPADVHRDILSGDAFFYCAVIEKMYCHKYKQCIQQLNMSQQDKQILLNLISNGSANQG